MYASLRHRNFKNRRSRIRHRVFMNLAHRLVRCDAALGYVHIVEEYLGDFQLTRNYKLED